MLESELLRSKPGTHQKIIAQIKTEGSTIRMACDGLRPSEHFAHCVQLQGVYAFTLAVGGLQLRVDDWHIPRDTLMNYVAGLVGKEFPLDLSHLQGGEFSHPALPNTVPVIDIEADPIELPEPLVEDALDNLQEPSDPICGETSEPEFEAVSSEDVGDTSMGHETWEAEPLIDEEPWAEPALDEGDFYGSGPKPRLRDRLLGLLR